MAELEVPPNVYGVAMVLPSVLNRHKDGTCIFFFEHLRIWGLLFGNYGIQFLFVLELWKMVLSRKDEAETSGTDMACSNNVVILQFVCLFVFEVMMFTEIRDTTLILRLLWNIESPSDKAPGGAAFEQLDNRRHSAAGMVQADEGSLTKWAKKKLGQDKRSEWSMDGVSRCYRFFLFLVVGLPKFFLGFFIAYAGGWYVLESPDRETLILNTVAMTFIISIDEFLYHAFTPQSIIDNISSMQPVKVEIDTASAVGVWFLNSIVYPNVIFLACGCLTLVYKHSVCDSYTLPWEDPTYKLPWHKMLE